MQTCGLRQETGARDGIWRSARGATAQQQQQVQQPARGSAWEPYLREGARRQRAALSELSEPTLWRRLCGAGELVRGLWRRRDVHGARQLSAAALEVRVSSRRRRIVAA